MSPFRDAFTVLALCPDPGGRRPALAASATRGGAIGILDLEWSESDAPAAHAHVRWLIDRTGDAARIGVRLQPAAIDRWSAALEALRERASVVVLTSPDVTLARVAALRARGHAVIIEVRNQEDLDRAALLDPDAVIACGHECGGRVEEESAFVLLQRALQSAAVPVLARGGVGLKGAAACRAAGAAGIVLDDQLLLAPESPLSPAMRRAITARSGHGTVVVGPPGADRVRVFEHPTSPAVTTLTTRSRALEASGAGETEWAREIATHVTWRDDGAWPIGQGIVLAPSLARRFGSAGAIVRAVERSSARILRDAAAGRPLAAASPLAISHDTDFPIVQGPMTRVSDVPAFAAAVAGAGALPLVALAVLPGIETRQLLEQTRDLMGTRPWGVGLLGFVPPALKRAQMDEIRAIRPPFALVAGGRPDDAAPLEAAGIATYLHVPAASLLRRFLSQGARRFVFEGRECGGHVGPLGSFPLWETMTEELLEWASREEPGDLHVLFAGGIHDAVSAAMVSAFAAPLAARGVRCGVLMGTAYLFTDEAVATGAITEAYRREALECRETVLLVSGPGHANRVARTPFTEMYMTERRARLASGQPPEEIRDALERLTLGRLRLASKGLQRDDAGALVEASVEQQASGGVYMLGQAAALRHAACTMRDLHEAVADGAAALLADGAAGAADPDEHAVAIVGISVLVPGAKNPDRLWRRLLDRVSAIREVPREYFDIRVLYDEASRVPDRVDSKWGGFCDEVPFDPVQYRIPPVIMPQICAHQLLALELSRWALQDAGCLERRFDREATAVIIGVAETGGALGNSMIVRSLLPYVDAHISPATLERLPEWTGESFTGMLGNVTAGRIANQFDFGGANLCIDAACASSLLALDAAAREVRDGRAAMALAAGVDTLQSPFGYLGFSKTQALSPTGEARVFDESADGIVVSDGAVVMVLKRLADARRDGDRVYALVRGSGASADGRGLGLTAPKASGQRRAISRALAEAGVKAADLAMYEAHGTGTALGDRTELETLTGVLRETGARAHACVVGSAKSLIGHTKAAAGLVATLKTLLALRHQVLPPHAGVHRPLAVLTAADSPVCLLDRPRPWIAGNGRRRLAGVNAFGFGGTNASVVLEAADEADAPLGAAEWPAEIFAFAEPSADALAAALSAVTRAIAEGADPKPADLAWALARAVTERTAAAATHRAAIVATTLDELRESLAIAERAARGEAVTCPPRVRVGITPAQPPGVAFLFPGQGSQAPHMALDHTLYFAEVREAVGLADAMAGAIPRPLSEDIFPAAAFTPAEREAQRQALADTRRAQPALGAIAAGLLDLLERLEVRADAFAGHSYGELPALHAAGALSRRDLLRLSVARGRAMAECRDGGMLALRASRAEAQTIISGIDDVVLANHNGPRQCAVSGTHAAIAAVRAAAEAAGIAAVPLNVGGAFHSPLMADAAAGWTAALNETAWTPPQRNVYGASDGTPFPSAPAALAARLARQLQEPVDFVAQLEALYASGARVFVEVGPGSVLSRLAAGVLGDRPHIAVPLDPQGGHLAGLLEAVATLHVAGVPIVMARLFDGRDLTALALERLLETRPAPPPATAWWINGAGARPAARARQVVGRAPFYSFEERQAAAVTAPEAAASAITAPAPGATPAALVDLYNAYQETMRGFLRLQEQVIAASLSAAGTLPGALAGSLPPIAAIPQPAAIPPTAATPAQDVIPAAAVASSPAAASHAGTATAPGESVRDILLRVFSEQTGYPVEMLGLDMDLSADLGVDSIRQVQAFGDFADALPARTRAAIAPIADELLRCRTLGAVIDRIAAQVPDAGAGPPPAAGTPAPAAPAAAPAAASMDEATILRTLQQIAGEQTGYPIEMLDPHHDLDADLGIDSIRRADLLQALVEAVPAAARPRIGSLDEVLRARTLGQIAALIAVAMATPPGADQEEACPSFAPTEAIVPLIRSAAPSLPHGSVIVTEDEIGVAALAVEALARAGIRAIAIPREELASPEALGPTVAAIDGPVHGVLHLAGVGRAGLPPTLEEWRRHTQLEVKSLFQLLQMLAARPGFRPDRVRVVSASMLGGRYGRDGRLGPGTPAAGGAVGLLRTLEREWPGARGTAVDFAGDLGQAAIASAVVDELLFNGDRVNGDHVEIGYVGAHRLVFGTGVTPRASGPPDPALEPQAGWVVLATGGGRGITAEALVPLARPGVTIVLAGRTADPPAEPELTAGAPPEEVRRRLIADATARAERVTPAQVEARVRDILHGREMRAVRERLTGAGAAVVARACDVRGPALPALVREIHDTYGRLDAIVHGAGVIEDALLVNKSGDAFDRVFDTKVDGMYQLVKAVQPETLKLFVVFSSVSGRAGNEGQVDYAAANEVLARFAWLAHGRWPHARVVSIAWGPWVSGMADDRIRARLLERGIEPISASGGRHLLAAEMQSARRADVEIVAGLGPWDEGAPDGRESDSSPETAARDAFDDRRANG